MGIYGDFLKEFLINIERRGKQERECFDIIYLFKFL